MIALLEKECTVETDHTLSGSPSPLHGHVRASMDTHNTHNTHTHTHTASVEKKNFVTISSKISTPRNPFKRKKKKAGPRVF